MRFTSMSDFSAGITNPDIDQVFHQTYAFYEKEAAAIGFVIFGSYAAGTFSDDSDIDIALLYRELPEPLKNPEPGLKQELNRFVRSQVLALIPSLKNKKLLTVFAFTEEKWEQLYEWDNSIAHGIMGGLMLHYRGNDKKFLAKTKRMLEETPLNVRRYE